MTKAGYRHHPELAALGLPVKLVLALDCRCPGAKVDVWPLQEDFRYMA